MKPRLLFLSENIQLGGLALLELWRAHQREEIELVGVWSNAGPSRHPGLGANAFAQVESTQRIVMPSDPLNESALFNGVPIANYAQLARELRLPYQQVPRINAGAVSSVIKALKVDYGICIGYGQILKPSVRNAPTGAWLNFHPSLLPNFRGPFPGFWEFRLGAKESGVSLHEMADSPDLGPIVGQEAIAIDENLDFKSLVAKQAQVAAAMVTTLLPRYFAGEITPKPQFEHTGSYHPKPSPKDFLLTREMTCDQIFSFVRGLRNVAKAILVVAGEAHQVESVITTNPALGSERPGDVILLTRERARLVAADGVVEVLISPFPLRPTKQT